MRRSRAQRSRVVLSILSLLIVLSMGLGLAATLLPVRRVPPTPTLMPLLSPTPIPSPTADGN